MAKRHSINRSLLFSVSFFSLLLLSCNKDQKDNRANLSATIGVNNFSINNAKAVLHYESLSSSKGQLTIIGSDNASTLNLIINNFTSELKSYSIPTEAIAVYTNTASGLPDTAISGTITVSYDQTYNYIIPDQPFSSNSSTNNSSELIVGTFNFSTKASVKVSNGAYGIVFNK